MKKKKNKNNISLTAQQRRQQRKEQYNKEKEDIKSKTATEEVESEQDQILDKKQKRSAVIRVTAVLLACLIGVGAITSAILLIVLNQNQNNEEVNPIAQITLQNGKKIEVELLYKESASEDKNGRGPIANFIYLAESKFFDGTIFSNTLGGFFSLEGYTAPGQHKAKDEDFVATLKGFNYRPNKWGESNFKMGYRLTRQTIIAEPTYKSGYVAMLCGTGSSGTSTSFIMIYDNSAQLLLNNQKIESNLTYIGKMSSGSIEVLKEISSYSTTDNTTVDGWEKLSGWGYPTDYDAVRIKTVKIKQLNWQLKKNIVNRFEDFVLDNKSEMKGAIKGGSTYWDNKPNRYLP